MLLLLAGGTGGAKLARGLAQTLPAHQLTIVGNTGDDFFRWGLRICPDLDSLTEDTDFTVFLQDGVPKALRRQALRRLWRLNPVFANLDGLNDYDEDYSALGIVAENIKTIYKVGKGYLDEDEDEDEDEAEDEIAAGQVGEDETGGAEASAEPEPNPEPSIPSDPIDSTKVSLSAPESGSGQAAGSNREPESVTPVRGSALARRWGGSPDKG